MEQDKVFYALIVLFLMIGGGLVIKPMWFPQPEEAKPVAAEQKAAADDNAKVTETSLAPDADSSHANESAESRDSTSTCEKELRRTAELIRFFANRIQMGEQSESVVADMRQQQKRISEVCRD